jgi:hypothetical protein
MVDEVDRDDPAYKKRARRLILRNLPLRHARSRIQKPWNQVWKTDGSAHLTIHTKDNDNISWWCPTTHRGFCQRLTKRKRRKVSRYGRGHYHLQTTRACTTVKIRPPNSKRTE